MSLQIVKDMWKTIPNMREITGFNELSQQKLDWLQKRSIFFNVFKI